MHDPAFVTAAHRRQYAPAMEPLEPFPSSAADPVPQPPERPNYASWGARAGAILIDNLLMLIPLALAIVFFVAAAAADDDAGRDAGPLWVLGGLMLLLWLVVPFVYFAILNGNERGQTLGKRVAGIRTRRRDGSPLGVGRAPGRYALIFLLGRLFWPAMIVDYVWPVWDAERRTLHDKAVDSIVVKA